jgi:hypothetical protein
MLFNGRSFFIRTKPLISLAFGQRHQSEKERDRQGLKVALSDGHLNGYIVESNAKDL